MGRVYNSVGLDVLPREMTRTDLPGLTQELQTRIKEWESANFALRKDKPLPPIALAYSDRIEPEGREEIEKSLAQVLKSAEIATSPEAELSLIIDVELTPGSEGMLRSKISSRLKNKEDKLVLETEQRSTLSDPPSPQQWAAIGEAIGMKVSEQLNAQLRQKMPKALKD
jgi:hypothetical protein